MKTEIIELHEAGQTPEQILSTLQADPRHVRDVMAVDFDTKKPDLFDVLEHYDLMNGSLDATIAAQESAELTAAWEKLKRHMQVVNREVKCHSRPEIGLLTTTITNLAKATRPDAAAAIQTDMDALTGGLRFAGITLELINETIAAHEAQKADQAQLDRCNEAADVAVAAARADLTMTNEQIAAVYREALS